MLPTSRQLISHVVFNMVFALAMFAAAVALSAFETMVAGRVQPWLSEGMDQVSKLLFVIDAIVLLATAIITAVRILSSLAGRTI